MKRQRLVSFVLITVVAAAGLFQQAEAQGGGSDPGAPWGKRCKSFETPRQFVVDATLFCMRHPTTRDCQQKASRHFQVCRFPGDYKKMSQRVHARMLVVLALAGSATLRKGESM